MTYGDGLLTVTTEGITIDTGLSAREAGTAKLSQHQTEQGVIIKVADDGIVTYSSWSWTGSHEDITPGRKNYSVFVDGEPFEGKPLLTLMDEADDAFTGEDKAASKTARAKLAAAVNALSAAVEDAAEKNITLQNNGPLGTLVADDGRILLLPENVFVRALASRSGRDASRFSGCWKNDALQGIDGWHFTLACYAYRYLSGKTAFPQEDSQIRVADYFDRNFVPLSWFCTLKGAAAHDGCEAPDADLQALYDAIYIDLSKAAPVQETAKQKKKKRATKRSAIEDIKSVALPELPLYEDRECANYTFTGEYVRQQKKLKKTRFIRQNEMAIKWGGIALIVVLVLGISYIKDRMAGPTTKGMEPAEVLYQFYDAFDQLDNTLFDCSHSDDCANKMSTYLSTMFVTSKMRQSYEGMGNYTMNQWLNTKVLAGTYVFGITHLTFTPLSQEPPSEVPADTADEFSWKVHYYICYNMGNEEFSYIDQSDIITISWVDDRWLVTGHETVESISYEDAAPRLTVEAVTLQPDEYDLNTQGLYLLSQLKDTYPWLPTEAEVEKGRQQLLNGWNATEYQRVLKSMELN